MAHALLSPSSSHRWLHCPPSARLCEEYPDVPSAYAQEGTLAHECCERLLLDHEAGMQWMKDNGINSEMSDCAVGYYNEVMRIMEELSVKTGESVVLEVETRLSFSDWVPESYGTSDAIVVGGSDLWVIDFKYGRGVAVSAENNPQLMLYAAGAFRRFESRYPIKNIHMMIYQPRLDSVTTDSIKTADLLAWCESIKGTANLAYNGRGEFCAGSWCRFCKAKNECRARAELNLEMARQEFKPAKSLSSEELGLILTKIERSGLDAWVADIREEVRRRILSGEEIEGWKLVKGRSSRKFANPDAVIEKLSAFGVPEDRLYERKPKSPAQIEKLLGKKAFAAVMDDDDIQYSEGHATLTVSSDKRPAIRKTSAAEDFT